MMRHTEIKSESKICERRHVKDWRNLPQDAAGLVRDSSGGTELLQERRTALISAAVTGKIDVRNFATQK